MNYVEVCRWSHNSQNHCKLEEALSLCSDGCTIKIFVGRRDYDGISGKKISRGGVKTNISQEMGYV